MSVLENSLSWLVGFNEAVNDFLKIREKLSKKDNYHNVASLAGDT